MIDKKTCVIRWDTFRETVRKEEADTINAKKMVEAAYKLIWARVDDELTIAEYPVSAMVYNAKLLGGTAYSVFFQYIYPHINEFSTVIFTRYNYTDRS